MDKVLLIDDEADVQYSFRRIFDQADIELTTANSGEEGLKILPRLQPDLVIMDVRMGGMNGLETLRRLRQMDAKQMVIMMTAYGTTQTAIEAGGLRLPAQAVRCAQAQTGGAQCAQGRARHAPGGFIPAPAGIGGL